MFHVDRASVIVALVVCAILIGPGVAYRVGQDHPPPPRTLHDLPGWACREIVDLRRQKVQLVREVAHAYSGGHPKMMILFKLGDRKRCRR